MKIAITHADGQVIPLSACTEYLILTTENSLPVSKALVPCTGTGSTAMLFFMTKEKIDVLICGELSIVARNALEMLGVLIIPGVEGSAEEAVAKFLVGEKQGDPTVLDLCREEDPDDPMNCMHDCSKCAGCGPLNVPEDARKNLPKA